MDGGILFAMPGIVSDYWIRYWVRSVPRDLVKRRLRAMGYRPVKIDGRPTWAIPGAKREPCDVTGYRLWKKELIEELTDGKNDR